MKLKQVTLTGVDDKTDFCRLSLLTMEYPFVEWGVLMSVTRTGKEKRYPSLTSLQKFGDTKVNYRGRRMQKAVHLCGRLAHDAAAGEGYPLHTARQFVRDAQRIQINLGQDLANYPDIVSAIADTADRLAVQIILQTRHFDIPLLREYDGDDLPYSAELFAFLHDASGGRGIDGTFQMPVNGDLVGFAGGISPDNLEEKLAQIATFRFPNDYWIDMESGVRTCDVFDLDKAEHVLRLAKPYVEDSSR